MSTFLNCRKGVLEIDVNRERKMRIFLIPMLRLLLRPMGRGWLLLTPTLQLLGLSARDSAGEVVSLAGGSGREGDRGVEVSRGTGNARRISLLMDELKKMGIKDNDSGSKIKVAGAPDAISGDASCVRARCAWLVARGRLNEEIHISNGWHYGLVCWQSCLAERMTKCAL